MQWIAKTKYIFIFLLMFSFRACSVSSHQDTASLNKQIENYSNPFITQIAISNPTFVTVTGEKSPNFFMKQARVLSTNSNGSFNMSFTLQCANVLNGRTLTTYSCDSIFLNSQLDYVLVPNVYVDKIITVAEMTSAFELNTPTSVGNFIVGPRGSDLNFNTLENGGFYTNNENPLVTSSFSVLPDNLNYLFLLRQKSVDGAVQSFTFYNIDFVKSSSTLACGATFAGGDGSVEHPFQVQDAAGLTNVGSCTLSAAYFVQTQDIDLSKINWNPINLYGQYNGNNHSISNLTISNTSDAKSVDGLFSFIQSGASVYNLTLNSVNISSQAASVGSLAGVNNGSIKNVSANGSITATVTTASLKNDTIGGLLGSSFGNISSSSTNVSVGVLEAGAGNYYVSAGALVGYLGSTATIVNSYATGSLSIQKQIPAYVTLYLGGLVGQMNSSIVSNSYSTGDIQFPGVSVSGSHYVYMGFVGLMNAGTIAACFSSGTYSASGAYSAIAGGMVGSTKFTNAMISNSYTMSDILISGATFFGLAGGFIGTPPSTASGIKNSYSAGARVTSNLTSQGFIGSNTGSAINAYYDSSGEVPSDVSFGVTGLTDAQMLLQSKFSGFTFGTDSQNWVLPSVNPMSPKGLLSPVLRWQCNNNGIVCP